MRVNWMIRNYPGREVLYEINEIYELPELGEEVIALRGHYRERYVVIGLKPDWPCIFLDYLGRVE